MLRKLLLAALLLFPFCLLAQGRDLPDFADLVDKQGAAVVNISTTQTVRGQTAPPGSEEDPFYDFFRRFGPPQPPRDYETRSLGSGFIISQEGYILTNSHVVEAADDITVRLTDKREYKAKVIGSDRRSDVAVLKIDANGLPVLASGDQDLVATTFEPLDQRPQDQGVRSRGAVDPDQHGRTLAATPSVPSDRLTPL